MTSFNVPVTDALESTSSRLEVADCGDEEWDAFVAAHPEGHHEQSSRYGQMRSEWGFRCERIVLREDGRIAGGLQVLARRSPVGTFAQVQRAPLAVDGRRDVLDRLAREFNGLA